MNVPSKSLKNGFSIPAFGIGTSGMGKGGTDEKDVAAIRTAIEMGITSIDTAESYSGGHAEELVGEAIQGYDRSKLQIASKVFSTNMAHDALIAACRASLARAKIDYFDLYLLHRVPPVPMEEAVGAMNELADMGLIKNIGISNFGVETSAHAQRVSKRPIVYNQVHYSLSFREPEKKGLLAYCQDNDVFLAAWKPVDRGTLLVDPPAIVLEICKKYEKTPAQITINWLLSQKNVVTLSKMSSAEHIKENLGAVGWDMEAVDIERLRNEYPVQHDKSDIVALDAQ